MNETILSERDMRRIYCYIAHFPHTLPSGKQRRPNVVSQALERLRLRMAFGPMQVYTAPDGQLNVYCPSRKASISGDVKTGYYGAKPLAKLPAGSKKPEKVNTLFYKTKKRFDAFSPAAKKVGKYALLAGGVCVLTGAIVMTGIKHLIASVPAPEGAKTQQNIGAPLPSPQPDKTQKPRIDEEDFLPNIWRMGSPVPLSGFIYVNPRTGSDTGYAPPQETIAGTSKSTRYNCAAFALPTMGFNIISPHATGTLTQEPDLVQSRMKGYGAPVRFAHERLENEASLPRDAQMMTVNQAHQFVAALKKSPQHLERAVSDFMRAATCGGQLTDSRVNANMGDDDRYPWPRNFDQTTTYRIPLAPDDGHIPPSGESVFPRKFHNYQQLEIGFKTDAQGNTHPVADVIPPPAIEESLILDYKGSDGIHLATNNAKTTEDSPKFAGPFFTFPRSNEPYSVPAERHTGTVPAPNTLALLAVGMFGLYRSTQRKPSSAKKGKQPQP